MAFERPTLETLIARAAADAGTRLAAGAPLLPVSNLAVLARVLAGAVHGLYGYLDWIAQQTLPDTADADALDRHAALWGLGRLPAAFAGGHVTLSGTLGTVVPADVRLRRADGVEVVTTAALTLDGSTPAAVSAVLPGVAANTAAGTALTLVSAVPGVSAAAVVAAGGLTGGADAETDTALRTRVLWRLQQPPHGGCAADYLAWALAAHPAVTRAWVFPNEAGAGSVTVRVMTDGASSDGIPSAEVTAAVAAAIAPLRPVTARVVVVAPVAVPLSVTLLPTPDTLAVRSAITAAVRDLIQREAAPGGTLLLSHLRAELSAAVGETNYVMASPAADVVMNPGYITTFGSMSWSAS